MPPLSHLSRTVALIGVVAMLAAGCGRSTPKKPTNTDCPEGKWMIVGDQLRSLLGAEIGPNAKATEIIGTVTLRITASGTTSYEFSNVILASTTDAKTTRLGVQGSIVGESAFTMSGMSTTVAANTLRFSTDGFPANSEFTMFASTNLEKALTGAATYQCGPSRLTITDTSQNTTIVWSAA